MHPANAADTATWPHEGRERVVISSPIGWVGSDQGDPEPAAIERMRAGAVMMMGDNPALPRMPERPTLLDFFRLRFGDFTVNHLLASAKRAMWDRLGASWTFLADAGFAAFALIGLALNRVGSETVST